MCKGVCVCKGVRVYKHFCVRASVGKSVCVTSSHLTSSPPSLSVPFSLPTTLSPAYSLGLAFFYVLAVVLCRYMFQCPSSAFILTLLYPAIIVFLLLTPNTSYIRITLCFYLRLSNLLLYALRPSVYYIVNK